MVAPTPRHASIDLANEAKNLPLEAHDRRARLLWRLRGLVRQAPGDAATRLGLMFAAFHSGDRLLADEQLSWLAAAHASLETAILTNIAAPLVMVGNHDKAGSVLKELARRPDRPYLDMGQPETHGVWALLIGDHGLAQKLAQGYPAAERFLAAVEERNLGTPVALHGAAAAEAIGPHACDLSLEMNPCGDSEGAFMCCTYRVPEDRNTRKKMLRDFDSRWSAKLEAQKLREIDYLGVLLADVLPLPVSPLPVSEAIAPA